jgi:hypothetical protein
MYKKISIAVVVTVILVSGLYLSFKDTSDKKET